MIKYKLMENKCVKVGVGVLVFDKEGKILLMKRAGSYGQGTWAPPGGHVEFGETAISAAKREVKEEVGIGVKNAAVIGITEDISVATDHHYITVFVQAEWSRGLLKTSDREFTEMGFFDINDLPKPLFISFNNLMKGKLLPDHSCDCGSDHCGK